MFEVSKSGTKSKANCPKPGVQVQVTGKQFNWEVLYPGPDGAFDTQDDHQGRW